MTAVTEQRVRGTMPRPRWFRAAGRVAVALAIVGAMTACGGRGDSFEDLNLDERNAAATPAVAYKSGAAFIKALDRAGVACVEHGTSPVEVSGIHVADNVECTYADGDWVAGMVAVPSKAGRAYFGFYLDDYLEARSKTGSRSLVLKGKHWFAHATTEQRLFATQDALGGSLLAGLTQAGSKAAASGVLPTVCQDARNAFHDWATAAVGVSDSTDHVVGLLVDLSIKMGESASSAKLTEFADEVNEGVKGVETKLAKSDQSYQAFTPLFAECAALDSALVPPPCADEIGQYPTVTAALTKMLKAEAVRLNKALTLRTAVIGNDQGAIDASVKKLTAATDKVNAAVNKWSNTAAKFNASVEACNKAIS